jgi:hypothetical protein
MAAETAAESSMRMPQSRVTLGSPFPRRGKPSWLSGFSAPKLHRPHKEGHMTHVERDEDAVVVGTDNARQGVTGHHVRYVLAFGLAGVIIIFILFTFVT